MNTTPTNLHKNKGLFNHAPPSKELLLSVVVPVRNEAAHLLKTLEALRLQVNAEGIGLPNLYEVLLLTNNCTDDSFAIAEQYRQSFPEFQLRVANILIESDQAHVGTVRRLLMDEAYDRLISVTKNGIIASTDGDTEVDRKWIFTILKEINKGIDAVGGKIVIDHHGTASTRYYLHNEIYRGLIAKAEAMLDPIKHDPWPRHFHYFGGNLAVTCAMYVKVGGLPVLPYLEDEAFHNALVLKDAKIRKSRDVKVLTSSRTIGRVALGLSQQLKDWQHMEVDKQPLLAEPAEQVIAKIKSRQLLRLCWAKKANGQDYNFEVDTIAKELLLEADWLQNIIQAGIYFGQVWSEVEQKIYSGKWHNKWQTVVITKSIRDLTTYLQKNRR